MAAKAPFASHTIELPDEAATLALGGVLAAALRPGDVVFLSGDLGAGKTTLTRGVLRGLGFEGRVKSPTYTLVELYEVSRLHLYHFDFYRFADPQEWQESGFRDLFNEANICLVEWPEKAGELLPPSDLSLALKASAETSRQALFQAWTPRGQALLKALP